MQKQISIKSELEYFGSFILGVLQSGQEHKASPEILANIIVEQLNKRLGEEIVRIVEEND